MQIDDLNFYTFRERTTDDDGDPRLLVAHADPNEYEYSLDFIFPTAEAAWEWLDEQIADLRECGDDPSEYESLVLVHFKGEEVTR